MWSNYFLNGGRLDPTPHLCNDPARRVDLHDQQIVPIMGVVDAVISHDRGGIYASDLLHRQTQESEAAGMMWRKGTNNTEVVSNTPTIDAIPGSNDIVHYGGYLVAESVAPSLVPLIVEAPTMLDLLKRYVADDPCAPGDPRYAEAVAIIERIEPDKVVEDHNLAAKQRMDAIDELKRQPVSDPEKFVRCKWCGMEMPRPVPSITTYICDDCCPF